MRKPSNFVVRDATAADAPAVADVHVRTWQEAYAGQLPQELLDRLPESLDRRERRWRSVAETVDARKALLVAECDGEVVGFAHVCKSRDESAADSVGEVTAIYVRKPYWGRGIGRRLFAEATKRLRTAGFESAMLWVLESNARTRRFYEAAGWRSDGSEKTEQMGDVTLREVRYRADL